MTGSPSRAVIPTALARRWEADRRHHAACRRPRRSVLRPADADLVRDLVGATSLPLQIGGGFRTLADVADAFEEGAARVIVGTAALDADFLETAVETFGDRLVVAVDARDGLVTVDGWLGRRSSSPPASHRLRDRRRRATPRHGNPAGRVARRAGSRPARRRAPGGLPVLAAGGIATIDDLRRLRAIGCEGAVVGSALLAGRFTIEDARAALAE